MSVIGRLFGLGGGQGQKMAPIGLAAAQSPKIDAGAQAARERQRQLAGMQGTIMTGGLGDETEGKRTRKSLLGE